MLPRSGRVGTIYTSAAEVRDRSRPAHGAFYSTISLPGPVYRTLAGKRGNTVQYRVQLADYTVMGGGSSHNLFLLSRLAH